MAETRVCPNCGAELAAEALSGLCPRCLLAAGLESQGGSEASQLLPTQSSPHSASHGGFVPPRPEELAGRFPQLEVIELLGKGGMGAVYKARQTGLDRLVALKILPPEVSVEPGFAERFTRPRPRAGYRQSTRLHSLPDWRAGTVAPVPAPTP